MKTFNHLYNDYDELKQFVTKINYKPSKNDNLIQIFTGNREEKFIYNLIKEVESVFPEAKIIGATTGGEILDNQVLSNSVIISFSIFNKTNVKVKSLEINKGNEFLTGITLANSLTTEKTKVLILFSDGINTNADDILKGIESINNKVIVAGGCAAANGYMTDTLVFTNHGLISSQGIVAAALDSDCLKVNNDYSLCWTPIGKKMVITKAEKNRVYTVDNMDVISVYRKYLGNHVADNLPLSATEFPFMIHRPNISLTRVAFGECNENVVSFIGNVYEGEFIQFSYGNIDMLINNSVEIMNRLLKKPIESVFVYSCTARRVFMNKKIEHEIYPLSNISTVSGFFTYGEFFHTVNSNNELLNITTTYLTLSENNILSNDFYIEQPSTSKIDNFVDNKEDYVKEVLSHLVNSVTKELEAINFDLKQKNQALMDAYEKMNNITTIHKEFPQLIDTKYSLKQSLAIKLRKLRELNNKNQEDIAKVVGKSRATVAHWENENSDVWPRVEELVKLAQYFNVSIDYLLGHEIK